jgi:hypothetical protein
MRSERPLLLTALHVAGLWAIAVVQPLLDVVGRAPEFFVAHRAGSTDILLLLAALLLLAPLAPIALIGLAGVLGSRARAFVTGMILTVLVGLVAVQVLKQLGVATWTVAAAPALATGLLAAVSYSRFAGFRSFFTMLAAGIVVVPVAFAQQPGIRRLIVPHTKGSPPAEPGAAGFRPAPVVLIVFDELPLVSLLDEHRGIDPAHYPNMSALARDGVWFRNATTVSAYTRWALPAIVTGLRPKRDAVPTSGNFPDTLFSFLGRTHRFEVIESLSAMCPRSLCIDPSDTVRTRLSGIGADLSIIATYVFLTPDLHKRLQLPDVTAQWAGFKRGVDAGMDMSPRAWQRNHAKRFMEDRRQLVTSFVDGISASDQQPTLYFLHTLLPHQPWVLLPSGQRNSSLAPLPGALREVPLTDEWELAQNQQRHLLQVGFIDRLVGRVIARLKDTGLYERALVVITADHGVAFMAGQPNRTLSLANVTEIMRVPLFVKFPAGVQTSTLFPEINEHGQRVSDRNVEAVDIAPTVADALGLRLSWATDGGSLLDVSVPPRPEKWIAADGGSTVQRYGADGPPIDGVLRRRIETFGRANVYRIPRPPRFGELVGHPVSDYRVGASHEITDVRHVSQYARFDPEADAVPFDVSGDLRGRSKGGDPAYLAIAVNGVIQAVTRTWTSKSGWLATPPVDTWRRGRNSLDVFLIAESDAQPVLARVQRPTSPPEDLNLISGGAEHYWEVRLRGFRQHERMGDGMIRWTRANASLTVPLLGRKPAAIRLKIARAVEPTTRLSVTANGCTLYEGVVPKPEWEATLPLTACDLTGDALTLGLRTNATRPRNRTDPRRLGVAVRHVVLEMGSGRSGTTLRGAP